MIPFYSYELLNNTTSDYLTIVGCHFFKVSECRLGNILLTLILTSGNNKPKDILVCGDLLVDRAAEELFDEFF